MARNNNNVPSAAGQLQRSDRVKRKPDWFPVAPCERSEITLTAPRAQATSRGGFESVSPHRDLRLNAMASFTASGGTTSGFGRDTLGGGISKQPDHRPEGPSGRTATACIVTHHRDLRCPGPTIGLQAPRPDHRPADALPTTGRRGRPPSAWPAQRMSPAQPPAKPDHRLGRPPAQQK
ncbi:hypothetical protein Bbelb_331770, partial [Branchiostoma belcheri]